MKPYSFGTLLITLVSIPTFVFSESDIVFTDLLTESEQRIEAGLAEYEAFKQSISQDKLQIVSEINELENDLVRLNQQLLDSQNTQKRSTLDLEEVQNKIKNSNTQIDYVSGVFSEYLNSFESRLNVAEDQKYSKNLRAIRKTLEEMTDDAPDRFKQYFKTLTLGLDRQESLLGGTSFEGRAITSNGGVKEGTLLVTGPQAYFVANDHSTSGIATFNSGTMEPGVVPLSAANASLLQAVVENGEGMLPLDASLGKAIQLKKARGSIFDHVSKGGWVGYVIIGFGVMTLLIALIKMKDLKEKASNQPINVKEIATLAINDMAKAREKVESIRGPMSRVLMTGLDFIQGDASTVLEAMEAVIMRSKPQMERFLPFLATTAAAAPLLGLLGTVVGMIKTFTLIEVFGTGNAKSLSSGISEALVTTELGLIVAIPALILHGIFSRIINNRIGTMEQLSADFERHVSIAKKEKDAA